MLFTNATPLGGFTTEYTNVGSGKFLGLSYLVWIALVVAAITWFIFNMTRHGKYMYAIGGNPQAAEVAGVPVKLTLILIYMKAAAMYGLSLIHIYQAKVVIFDEPTSSLSDKEVDALFRIMNDLRSKGVAMIYISHKMDEIKRIADDITVMRDGGYVGTWPAAETVSYTHLMYEL